LSGGVWENQSPLPQWEKKKKITGEIGRRLQGPNEKKKFVHNCKDDLKPNIRGGKKEVRKTGLHFQLPKTNSDVDRPLEREARDLALSRAKRPCSEPRKKEKNAA